MILVGSKVTEELQVYLNGSAIILVQMLINIMLDFWIGKSVVHRRVIWRFCYSKDSWIPPPEFQSQWIWCVAQNLHL